MDHSSTVRFSTTDGLKLKPLSGKTEVPLDWTVVLYIVYMRTIPFEGYEHIKESLDSIFWTIQLFMKNDWLKRVKMTKAAKCCYGCKNGIIYCCFFSYIAKTYMIRIQKKDVIWYIVCKMKVLKNVENMKQYWRVNSIVF